MITSPLPLFFCRTENWLLPRSRFAGVSDGVSCYVSEFLRGLVHWHAGIPWSASAWLCPPNTPQRVTSTILPKRDSRTNEPKKNNWLRKRNPRNTCLPHKGQTQNGRQIDVQNTKLNGGESIFVDKLVLNRFVQGCNTLILKTNALHYLWFTRKFVYIRLFLTVFPARILSHVLFSLKPFNKSMD